MKTFGIGAALLIALALTNAGCKKPAPAASTAAGAEGAGGAPTAEGLAEAKQIFATRCTPCHGPSGKGDGPASATLNPKPRNYTDKQWQAATTDEHIEKIVVYGGAAVGKSPAMPANPDLQDKADVVRGLRSLVRDFGK